ncbi:MAS20-domain-containing protein [Ramaria rubella]|nr:MAS20-domain-containing protein [Ramaria rubella]
MSRTTTFATFAALTVLTAIVGYAAYFDYKRRNDVAFRKRLRKEQKRAHRTAAKAADTASSGPSKEELREALQRVKDEKVPENPEEKEQYFMQSVGVGEQLCAQGEAFYFPAALSFYRALRVYPSPVELIIIYQKTVPEPVFKIVMEMTSLDMQARIEGYYDHFPPQNMNVSITTTSLNAGSGRTMKNILIITRDVEAGETIYKEEPVVAALDPDLESAGSHCSHCLRHIDPVISLTFPDDPLQSVYCSKACQATARSESHNLLFSLEPSLPESPIKTISMDVKEARKTAQKKLIASLNNGYITPLLVARFVGRQVTAETQKLSVGIVGTTPITASRGVSNEDYSLYDHIERLRYLELSPQAEEAELISQLLKTVIPGLEQYITDERYATLKGKMAYNAIGISYGDGRANKPASRVRPEHVEKTRTPYGTDRQTGCGLYPVSSYQLSHSCNPSVRPSFPEGTSTLHLIANHALAKGDELTMAYVDVSQGSEETLQECRLRRRKELARGWRFTCVCQRCLEEAPKGDGPVERNTTDESKVEDVVHRYESNKTALG